jgi:hypothetical protein
VTLRLDRAPRFRRRRRTAMVAALSLVALLAFAIGAMTAAGSGVTPTATPGEPAILTAAKLRNPARYRYTVRQKAKIALTSDRRSFTVSWQPSATKPPRAVIVTLHGFSSTAFDQFALWHRYAKARGYGLIAIQWRRGFDSSAFTYHPQSILNFAAAALTAMKAKRGSALLHGFSSGGIRIYSLAALDHREGHRFGMFLANAGAAVGNYPLGSQIEGGAFGAKPFGGERFVLFCGGKDPHPDYTGCPAMDHTRKVITSHGGEVDDVISDPTGGHASFFVHPANVKRALDTFESVLQARGF